MINRVILVGRLTADPELRRTNSGASVASFTVAVDNGMKNPDGSRGTCFMNCSVFNNQADNVAKFTRKDGTNASVIEVICDSVKFLEPKAQAANAEQDNSDNLQDTSFDEKDSNLDGLDLPDADDDLPF